MYCPNQECPDLPPDGSPNELTGSVSVCPLCGAGLVESVPSWANQSNKDMALVPCMTVANVALLPHIKGILDSAEVEYFVKNDGLQNLLGWGTVGLGYSQVFGPPVVMVAADELDRARELLNALGERPADDAGSIPARVRSTTATPPNCLRCGKELEGDSEDDPLTHCYHCGSPLESA